MDEYLDYILKTLLSKGSFAGAEFLKHPGINTNEYSHAIAILTDRNFIKITHGEVGYWWIEISSKGKYFIEKGGFQHENTLKNVPLKSIKISKLSIIIAVISLILSLIAILTR